ncbi:MAG: hypothetical protein HY553_17065 [Elusimicrobia bacterium]|nr:hypothetical protein [Elusimicrobiota bacterium]
MKARLLLATAALLSVGCAAAKPRRQIFQYSGMVMIRAESWEVDQACARLDTRNDEGAGISRHIRCCWDSARRQMWVSWDEVDCVPHELCHVDGQTTSVCRKMHWQ